MDLGRQSIAGTARSHYVTVVFLRQRITALDQIVGDGPMDLGLHVKLLFDQLFEIINGVRRCFLVERDSKGPRLAHFSFFPLHLEHGDIFGRQDGAGYDQRYCEGDKSFYHGMIGRLRSSAVPIKSELSGFFTRYREPGWSKLRFM